MRSHRKNRVRIYLTNVNAKLISTDHDLFSVCFLFFGLFIDNTGLINGSELLSCILRQRVMHRTWMKYPASWFWPYTTSCRLPGCKFKDDNECLSFSAECYCSSSPTMAIVFAAHCSPRVVIFTIRLATHFNEILTFEKKFKQIPGAVVVYKYLVDTFAARQDNPALYAKSYVTLSRKRSPKYS